MTEPMEDAEDAVANLEENSQLFDVCTFNDAGQRVTGNVSRPRIHDCGHGFYGFLDNTGFRVVSDDPPGSPTADHGTATPG